MNKLMKFYSIFFFIVGFILGLLVCGLLKTCPIPEVETIIIEKPILFINDVSHKIKEKVEFTNYYVNDNSGSGVITSSGLSINNFEINDKGWYTYENKVVIAAATNLCIEVKTGPCGNYNYKKDTHHYFDLYQTITIIVDNEEYEAIVLDSCGACNWDEKYQRIDIFISDKAYSIGKMKGAIIY